MKSKIVKLTAVLFTAAALFLLTISTAAMAVGIGVTPGKMDFSVEAGSSASQMLYVTNPDGNESEFEVYIDGANAEWFTITPSNFTLTGQEQKSVEIVLAPPFSAIPQEYNLSICVVSKAPNTDLTFGAGVKVQTNVQIIAMKAHTDVFTTKHILWIASAVIGLAAVVAAGLGMLVWKRRKTRHA